ncbi:hypothetical protein DYBT9275_00583 [Dyadobacter sp. CECT 9275]|uniref:DM13 domain-containing protein n=1 Tax=Dyadobacter helix TaxID=2822344 RepID=A0A916J8R1_9BACT|nr:DM13 domain-containing protein [Dyadobacter sp. CECT 9275]CAG4990662.1 hypothetical protein DYBT9275_00583 [Dyadobacter sp. CECT 9275]
MKNPAFILLVSLVFAACQREENTPVEPLIEKVDSLATVNLSGKFMGTSGESVSGTAKILSSGGNYSLVLDDFKTNNGPDLHVYLSKDPTPKDFIDLGLLKSVSGTQVYPITAMPDFVKYKYVLIHCQQYNHLFGVALLAE